MFDLAVKIQEQVCTVILGKEDIVRKVLTAILARGNVLLEDVPGVGKTTLANAFAKTLGLSSRRVQFTTETMPSDIIGFSVYNREKATLEYKPGAVMTNLLLADEINRTSGKTQAALLEAMEERRVTVDGVTYPLPEPFFVIATQNPVGSVGTQLLPASQLDRFMLRLTMGYPDKKSQTELFRDRHTADPLESLKPVTDVNGIMKLIDTVDKTFVHDKIYEYVSELTEKSREHPYVRLGISPRGGLALCRAAKACAFLNGRDYVVPADVEAMFSDVCAHRLVLTSKAQLHEKTAEGVLAELLTQVEKPGEEKE